MNYSLFSNNIDLRQESINCIVTHYPLEKLITDGEFGKAIEYLGSQEKEVSSDIEKLFWEVQTARIARRQGDFSEAYKRLKPLYKPMLASNDTILTIFYYVELIWVTRLSGFHKSAAELIPTCYTLFQLDQQEKQVPTYPPKLLFAKSKLLANLSTKQLTVLHKFVYSLLFKLYYNHGVVYYEAGEIHRAIDKTKQALEVAEALEIRTFIADALNNLGVQYWYHGGLDQAIEHLTRCLEERRKNKVEVYKALALLNLIQVNIEFNSNRLETAQNYLLELEETYSVLKTPRVETYLLFGRAIIAKQSKRFNKIVEAERIFKDLIYHPQLDSQHLYLSYYYLAEILLYELSITKENEVFQEISELIASLTETAVTNNNKAVLSRAMLLQARLKLIEGDIKWAKYLMKDAILLAENIEDKRLLLLISKEYDHLLLLREDTPEVSIQQKLPELSFNQGVTRFNEDSEKIKQEVPIMFLILNNAGNTIFSKILSSTHKMNEMLIGNFMSAFEIFGKEAFDSETQLEIVKYEQFYIMMRTRGQLRFVYIFDGNTFYPSIKMRSFIENIFEEKLLTKYHTSSYTMLSKENEQIIDNLFISIFT